MRIDNTRYYVINNEIHGSFCDYVAIIKPFVFFKNEEDDPIISYNAIFTKGNYKNAPSIAISCDNLEEVLKLINKYQDECKTFDTLVEKIRSDYADSAVLKTFDKFK